MLFEGPGAPRGVDVAAGIGHHGVNLSKKNSSFRPRPYTFWNAAIPQTLQSVAFMISTLVEVPGVFGRAKLGAEGACITH